MRVLLCNYEYPPVGGGAGNATQNIGRELVELGHDVTVLTSRYGSRPPVEVESGVRVHRVVSWRKGIHECGIRGAWSYVATATPAIRRLARETRFDVVHYFFSLPTGALSLVPGPHRRPPYIVSLRGSDVPHYDDYNRSLQTMHRVLAPVTRRIWRRARRVVALSEALRETARRANPDIPIDVIPNGVETDLFTPAEALPLPEPGRLRIITVSRLVRRKGVQHLLRALAEVRDEIDAALTIVGEGSHREELRALTADLELEEVVCFHGYCPRPDLVELYRQANLFALPSMAESFGMAFAEAMACGLPILGGRTGGVPDLVRPENGILVEPESPGAIADALRTFAASPALRAETGARNRERVVRHYGWRSVAEAYESLYTGRPRARESVLS